MSPEQYERVKRAVLAFIAKGGTMKRGTWGVGYLVGAMNSPGRWLSSGNCACALGAFLVEEQPPPVMAPSGVRAGTASPATSTCAKALGTRSGLVGSFIAGFDGGATYRKHPSAPEEMRAWYLAGERMREELTALGHMGAKEKRSFEF